MVQVKIDEIESRFKIIEEVLAELPTDYQPVGFFLRLSGAGLETALGLNVSDIVNAFKAGYAPDLHLKFLVGDLGGVLSANAVDYLLKYIVTLRKAILHGLRIDQAKSSQAVFIDQAGLPLQPKSVVTAFRMASTKSRQGAFITPHRVRQTVAAAYAEIGRCRHTDLVMTLGYMEANSGAFAEN
jgi:hypothetical protein